MTTEQLKAEIESTLRKAEFSPSSRKSLRVSDLGRSTLVEIVVFEASNIPRVKEVLARVLNDEEIVWNVRSIWEINEIGEPQALFAQNGSPFPGRFVPVVVRSGRTEITITVGVTPEAEMRFERLLGGKPKLELIARLVIENKLKLGGTSAWSPREGEYFEVASNAVTSLSRELRKSA